jgi:DNA polymerase-3 subunit delta'
MLFSDVIGQDAVKHRLITTVRDNRVSHAQLFLGPEGSGNLAMAIAYAQYICCANREAQDSCGVCPSCLKYSKLAHPDLHFIYPINSTKDVSKPASAKFIEKWREAITRNAYLSLGQWYSEIGIENKQGLINVVDCNEIIKKLSLKAFESEYKVMVIWRPERMYHASAPKLLKILEEPPAKTLFLLVGENREEILATIVSRTQMVKLKRIGEEDLTDALSRKYDLERKESLHLAKQSEGNYTEALRLMESNETREFNSQQFRTWMRYCFKSDWIKVSEWIDAIAKLGRERQKNFLQYCLGMVRQSLLLNYRIEGLVVIEGEDLAFAEKFSPFVNSGNCIEFTEILNTAYHNIERNANPRILLLDLSMKISGLLKLELQRA